MKDNNIITRSLFAKNLKQFRNDLNISQMDLADITELSHNYINDLEHEKKWPSFKTIVNLAEALKIEPYQLLMPESKLKINDAEFLIEELTYAIAFMVKEKCDRYIISSNKNESEKSNSEKEKSIRDSQIPK